MVVSADRQLLRSVLVNLLGNAWKYTGNSLHPVITVGRCDGAPETFFVGDNGIGFEVTSPDELFVPFRRLPGSEGFGGHGVGLATTARIIRKHGGRIWAEAKPGEGATFFFTLGPA
jgi:signal transduction histidine kinase